METLEAQISRLTTEAETAKAKSKFNSFYELRNKVVRLTEEKNRKDKWENRKLPEAPPMVTPPPAEEYGKEIVFLSTPKRRLLFKQNEETGLPISYWIKTILKDTVHIQRFDINGRTQFDAFTDCMLAWNMVKG